MTYALRLMPYIACVYFTPNSEVCAQARVLHACELIRRQRYLEAAAHLARAATYEDFDVARKLLVQVTIYVCVMKAL